MNKYLGFGALLVFATLVCVRTCAEGTKVGKALRSIADHSPSAQADRGLRESLVRVADDEIKSGRRGLSAAIHKDKRTYLIYNAENGVFTEV